MKRTYVSTYQSGDILTGKEFSIKCPYKLYKITNTNETHHGYQYHDGLNVDTLPFSATGECSSGGLYFADEKNIGHFVDLGCYIREVIIPDDATVYIEEHKYKTNKMILGQRQNLDDYIEKNIDDLIFQNPSVFLYLKDEDKKRDICEAVISLDGEMIKYVKQTPKLCRLAVENNGPSIRHIKNRTYDLCLTAVKQNGCSIIWMELIIDCPPDLNYCQIKTHHDILLQSILVHTTLVIEAIKQNARIIKLVNYPSQEMYFEAVKKDGMILEMVENQNKTQEICEAAVKQNGMAINFVPEEMRTPELFQLAITFGRYPDAIKLSKNPTDDMKISIIKIFGYFNGCDYGFEMTRDLLIKIISEGDITNDTSMHHGTPQFITCIDDMITQSQTTQTIGGVSIEYGSPIIQLINTLPEELLIKLVAKKPLAIRFIINQSSDVCLTAMRTDPSAVSLIRKPTIEICTEYNKITKNHPSYNTVTVPPIYYVNSPTYEECLRTVKRNGMDITYVPEKFQTEELRLIAIKQDPFAIQMIQDPSEHICLEAINITDDGSIIHCIRKYTLPILLKVFERWGTRNRGYLIKKLVDHSEEVLIKLVEKDGMFLQYIEKKYRTTNVCLHATRQNPDALQFVTNQTHQMCLECVRRKGVSIRYVIQQQFDIQQEAIRQAPIAIVYCDKPTEKLLQLAVSIDGMVIKYIDNPSQQVKDIAVKQNERAKIYIKSGEIVPY